MSPELKHISEKAVERLSLYRRILLQLREADDAVVFSRQLSEPAGVTAAQVRRDIMHLGCSGVPNSGYRLGELLNAINAVLDAPQSQRAALVGVGHLGLALMTHFSGRWRWLHIHAAFDADPAKCNTQFRGARCYPLSDLPRIIQEWRIDVGIITVPKDSAQDVADRLCVAGVRGLLNFAPVRLRVSDGVYVENVDLTTTFEKVAYFARHSGKVVNTREAGSPAELTGNSAGPQQ